MKLDMNDHRQNIALKFDFDLEGILLNMTCTWPGP